MERINADYKRRTWNIKLTFQDAQTVGMTKARLGQPRINRILTYFLNFSVFSIYILFPLVLCLNDLKLHKTYPVETSYTKKLKVSVKQAQDSFGIGDVTVRKQN